MRRLDALKLDLAETLQDVAALADDCNKILAEPVMSERDAKHAKYAQDAALRAHGELMSMSSCLGEIGRTVSVADTTQNTTET